MIMCQDLRALAQHPGVIEVTDKIPVGQAVSRYRVKGVCGLDRWERRRDRVCKVLSHAQASLSASVPESRTSTSVVLGFSPANLPKSSHLEGLLCFAL
jgi:hypothetical protein